MIPIPLLAAGTAALTRVLVAAVGLASITAGAIGSEHPGAATAQVAGGNAPNVLLIVVDDQASSSFRPMYQPQTFRWLVRGGTKFTNGLAAPPLCCPDRAGLLSGDYPHNSGVFWDDPGYASLDDAGDTLPVWLQRAGYRTGLVGKFMNGYDEHEGLAPAPGFESWFNLLGTPRYYGYQVSDQGSLRSYGTARRDYSTDVFARQAKQFIRQTSADPSPFFLWLGFDAPHTAHDGHVQGCRGNDPIPPDYKMLKRFRHVPLPRTANFNEFDVSDKPTNVADLPRISHRVFANIRRRFQCTLATDLEVDRAIGRIKRELAAEGELRQTIVFYYSDNGYFFGEHRIPRGKTLPYEPALRVPYAVRVPRSYRPQPQTRVRSQLVTNEDIPATILDFAGNPPSCASAVDCRTLDGRSIRPLLGGSGAWPSDRGILAEIDGGSKHWRAIRTPRYLYARYEGGGRELYDLRRDPDELHNLSSEPAASSVEGALADRLRRLRHCAGIQGRDQKLNGVPFCN
jgi:N-acetylglucosamine-6-sulfatase